VRIKWTDEAIKQLDAVHARYALIDGRLAARMFRELRQSVARLRQFPASGRRGQIAGTLEVVVANPPYLVVYRIEGEEVQILRVFHSASDWWHAAATLESDGESNAGG
jgi:addiction module RelE/StbE family toxin